MHPPPPGSLKWHTWKLHDERDIESMGCIFSLIPITWTMQIINTKPRSLDLCASKSRSWKILTLSHGCIIPGPYTALIIQLFDLLWASLEKTIVMYHIVNSNVFYILFATNKCISGCVFSNQAHRLCCGAYFQVRVLANIDHTFVSIASLFAAIKIYIFKIKVIRVKSIFIKLNWLHN